MAHANWVIVGEFNEATLRRGARKKKCSTQELVTVGRYPSPGQRKSEQKPSQKRTG